MDTVLVAQAQGTAQRPPTPRKRSGGHGSTLGILSLGSLALLWQAG